MPDWITLDSVIQVLAVDTGGPSLSAEQITDLLTSLLENDLQPTENTFTAEDLAFLLEIEDRWAEMPPESIEETAKKVARARLTGRGEADPDIRIQVTRAFQGARTREADDLGAVRDSLAAAQSELGHERAARNQIESVLTNDQELKIKRNAWKTFRWHLAALLIYLATVSAIGVWLLFAPPSSNAALGIIGGVLLTSSLGTIPVLWKIVRALRETLSSARAAAKEFVSGIGRQLEPEIS